MLRQEVREAARTQSELERLRKAQVDQAELARIKRDEAKNLREIAQLRGRLGAVLRNQTQPASNSTSMPVPGSGNNPAEAQAPATRTAGSAAGTTTEWMQAAVELHVDNQLARARERLQLTPDQEQNLRAAVNESLEVGKENLRKVLSQEARAEDVPTAWEWAKGLEGKILEALTPEQQTAYRKYKQEDVQANARLMANGELLAIQNSLGLTQEQQDQVFGALFNHAVNQLDPDPVVMSERPREPLAAAEWDAGRKLETMRSVLTPGQLDNYRRMQEFHLRFWRSATSKNSGAAPGNP